MIASLARDLKMLVSGEILEDQAAREDRSGDFGRMIRRLPAVVARPASTADIVAIIRYARRQKVPVATRGEAHSQSGQALTDGGILLDLTSLDRILAIDPTAPAADCQAGVRWEALVRRTILQGLVPPVLTNNLGVTIGGTLAVAGLGVASFRHGTQGDNVIEIEAVTGTGDLVVCSESIDREVFDAARSGLGQFAVIARARLRLRRCLPKTRTYFLLYDDLPAYMRDAAIAIEQDRFDYVESTCVPCPQGFRWAGPAKEAFAAWFFPLHATVEFDPQSPPYDAARLGGDGDDPPLDLGRSLHLADPGEPVSDRPRRRPRPALALPGDGLEGPALHLPGDPPRDGVRDPAGRPSRPSGPGEATAQRRLRPEHRRGRQTLSLRLHRVRSGALEAALRPALGRPLPDEEDVRPRRDPEPRLHRLRPLTTR